MDSLPPHIDLYNFEEPQFEDSKYVLTSPQSLEACSRLGIKPVELVYKPLSDYQEELLPQGLSLREIYQNFDEDEKERINKLYLCREEQNRVGEEDSFLETCGVTEVIDERMQGRNKMAGGLKMTTGIQEKAVKAVMKAQDREAERLKQKVEGLDEGSVQRRRTAWTTSIGHSRVTQRELKKRAEEIHREGKRLMNTGTNRKSAKAVVSTKKRSSAMNKNKQRVAEAKGRPKPDPSM